MLPGPEGNHIVDIHDGIHLPRLFNPDHHNQIHLPGQLDPPIGSHIYVQVEGGRILSGVMDNTGLNAQGPLELFTVQFENRRRIVASLHTLQNNNIPELSIIRCFIPIRRNFALASTLENHDPATEPSENTNVLLMIQEPQFGMFTGRLHQTNGLIPAWLHGLVNHPD